MIDTPVDVSLSLISHTNAGKTALARTLLGRDVGDVRDAPHVTSEVTAYTMVESAHGDALTLWDTPGFGDSARLARRLSAMDTPIVGFLAMAWDRWRDFPLWSSQQAIRNMRDHADVVLYLVNASESPQNAGYLLPELRILDWIGKPVIALLNQTGPPRAPAFDDEDEVRWTDALAGCPVVRGVATLDAFTRCWVQEGALLRLVAGVLPDTKRAAFARLEDAWSVERHARFHAAMLALATPIARAAFDEVEVPDDGLRGSLRTVGRAVGKAIGIADDGAATAKQSASRTLARRLDADTRASTDRLIAIHHLAGSAVAEDIERLAESVVAQEPVSERKVAMLGGLVSGALSGIVADIASGGLTFGAGMVAGGLLGAAGAAGLARGMNIARGTTSPVVRWSDEFLSALVPAAILRYLAVAHFGRGRGEWSATGQPVFWRDAVNTALASRGGVPPAFWIRDPEGGADALTARLQTFVEQITLDVLDELYPGSGARIADSLRRVEAAQAAQAAQSARGDRP